jgi:hypothetical protein
MTNHDGANHQTHVGDDAVHEFILGNFGQRLVN